MGGVKGAKIAKGEVCMKCEGVVGVVWGPQGSGHPISHVELGGSHRKATALFHLPLMMQLAYHT